MHFKHLLFGVFFLFSGGRLAAQTVDIAAPKMALTLAYGDKVSIVSLEVNGRKVISGEDGVYTSVTVGGRAYSSLHVLRRPVMERLKDGIVLKGIQYGGADVVVSEDWRFVVAGGAIEWNIERGLSKPMQVDEAAMPVMNFSHMKVWEGAFQGYGGLAWFYLFNEKLCTYGVHTTCSRFWDSKTGDGLSVDAEAPGKKVAMKYTREDDDRLGYTVTVSDRDLGYLNDSGTNRRRFVRGSSRVWAPFAVGSGPSSMRIRFRYFDFESQYGRGQFVGIDGGKVSSVLNTIARIGVIDSLHFGGNSWHTPYGPICLHEQYIGLMGLGIDDPSYIKGYQSCLDFYRDRAIRPDGRVIARWAYNNEDAMPGQFTEDGFYEAQWGFLMDSNPDYVSNVADGFDLSGDMSWVRTHIFSCEKALDWILKRDENHNGLVEMMTNSHTEARGSDWIDIIWASYENAFVNAKLYHALTAWAGVERVLGRVDAAVRYERAAALLKTNFNKSVVDGGFWDASKGCYVHWRDKDGSIHGNNMVVPVNFMAIAYGICDDSLRAKGILSYIEEQMQREKLFFWPLCLKPYEPGEGKEYQFPFPRYENGDLFLSWGSIGVQAYAAYDPALALKYVKNVLSQYAKDGLAYQRYGRVKQEGLGDDILSGNSLAIVGLYQSIYGIHPLYNRLYLAPRLEDSLLGTELKYWFHGRRLTIGFDKEGYSVGDGQFTVRSARDFGFFASAGRLRYFDGKDTAASLIVSAAGSLELRIGEWSEDVRQWEQAGGTQQRTYTVYGLKPGAIYTAGRDNKSGEPVKADEKGRLVLNVSGTVRKITLMRSGH